MTLPEPCVRPLLLPQLASVQAGDCTLLAQRMQALEVPWGEQVWSLSLTPALEPGPLVAGETEWCIQLSWGSVAVDLAVPGDTVSSWLRAQQADLDVSEIPEALAGILLEAAIEAMSASMGRLGQGAVRIDRLVRGPAEGRPLEHGFLARAACRDVVVFGRLAVGPTGLALMADLARELPTVPNGMEVDDLRPAWRMEVGCTWLALNDVERLAVGDFVLIEHGSFQLGKGLWLAAGDLGLRVALETSQLVVESPLGRGGWTMLANPDEAPAPPGTESLDQLPLRVVFDLGEISMPLGEVRRLQVGQSIELGHPLARAVRVRINGMHVATGELVEIDGHLGVTLTAVARQLTPDAPRMSARRGRKTAHDAETQAEAP